MGQSSHSLCTLFSFLTPGRVPENCVSQFLLPLAKAVIPLCSLDLRF
jgi:predicted NAD/FAD-binding protein